MQKVNFSSFKGRYLHLYPIYTKQHHFIQDRSKQSKKKESKKHKQQNKSRQNLKAMQAKNDIFTLFVRFILSNQTKNNTKFLNLYKKYKIKNQYLQLINQSRSMSKSRLTMKKNNDNLSDTVKYVQGKLLNYQICVSLTKNTINVNLYDAIEKTNFQSIYSLVDFSELLRKTYQKIDTLYFLIEELIQFENNKIRIKRAGQLQFQYAVYNYESKKFDIHKQNISVKNFESFNKQELKMKQYQNKQDQRNQEEQQLFRKVENKNMDQNYHIEYEYQNQKQRIQGIQGIQKVKEQNQRHNFIDVLTSSQQIILKELKQLKDLRQKDYDSLTKLSNNVIESQQRIIKLQRKLQQKKYLQKCLVLSFATILFIIIIGIFLLKLQQIESFQKLKQQNYLKQLKLTLKFNQLHQIRLEHNNDITQVLKTCRVMFDTLKESSEYHQLVSNNQEQSILSIKKTVNELSLFFQQYKSQMTKLNRSIQQDLSLINLKINLETYFDQTHPNFFRFQLISSNTISYISDYFWYHIMSPMAISETFTTYSYKVIKTNANLLMFGVASSQLRNDKDSQFRNDDFIGYYGVNNGYVYDQKGKYISVNAGGIRVGDVVTVKVSIMQRTVTWYKNKVKLYTSQISTRLALKKLYPTIFMGRKGDTVQIIY